MNNIHSFTKVILSAIGIFFAIRIISQMLMPLGLARMNPSLESVAIAIAATLFFGLCLAVICYAFVYKREQLAKRIIGTNELPEPDSQILWLPAAFRLICVTAGLYCLYAVLWNVVYNLMQYFSFKPDAAQSGYKVMYTVKILNIEQILSWLIMLAIGIYLVCGAPHFVRWQVRKTLKQCKAFEKIRQ